MFSSVINGSRRRLFRAAQKVGLIQYPVILNYHRVSLTDMDPWGLAVPPELFEEQLALLSTSWRVLSLSELGRLHCARQLMPDAVSITFDDGYACNAVVAAPLLEKYKLPATIFVSTGYISAQREFWWDALERVIFDTVAVRLTFQLDGEPVELALGVRDSVTDSSSWAAKNQAVSARQIAYLKCWSKLRNASEESRGTAMAELHLQAGVSATARPTHRAMTADEIRKLAKSDLIDIGAHGVNHSVLDRLTPAAQEREVRDSREACADVCGQLPYAFAYPYGDYNDDVIKSVRDAGFGMACTAWGRSIGPRSGLLEMPRLGVGAWNARELRMNLRTVERQ